MDLEAAGEAIVEAVEIAEEAAVLAAILAAVTGKGVRGAVGVGIEQVGGAEAELDLDVFGDVDGHQLGEREVVEHETVVYLSRIVVIALAGEIEFGVGAENPAGRREKDTGIETCLGAAVDVRGMGDIGEVETAAKTDADDVVLFFWCLGLLRAVGLGKAEEGSKKEKEKEGDGYCLLAHGVFI